MGDIYIINRQIIFCPDERKITSIETGDSVILQTPGALCLEEIIRKKGEIVSQANLFQIGWGEELSKHTTQSCYYQCFVNLRKQISSLGITEPVVITIPRRGMKFNDALSVVTKEETIGDLFNKDEQRAEHSAGIASEVEILPFPSKENNFVPGHAQSPKVRVVFRKWQIIVPLTLLLVFLVYSFYAGTGDYLIDDYAHEEPFEKCMLVHKQSEPTDNQISINIMKKHGYSCDNNKFYFIHDNEGTPRVSFFMCDSLNASYCRSVVIMRDGK